MYSYSRRLSWSLPLNSLSRLVDQKRSQNAALLDLTISNPTEVFSDYPHSAISRAYADIQDFSYHPNPCGLIESRNAISQDYAKRGIAVSAAQLLLTASTSEAYALLFKLFCAPGDEILAPLPSYPLFEYLAALECVRIIPYRLLYDGSWFVDFPDLHQRVSERTRAIIVVNPNNPTGSFLRAAELEKLTALAFERSIPIISDEVFMDYPFRASTDRVETLIGNDSVLSFSLNGLSKLAGMPQMKLGWITINGPAREREIARQRLELLLDTYLSVNTPVQQALPELLKIGAGIRQQIADRAKNNFSELVRILGDSPAYPLDTEGGWSAIIRLPRTLSEETWTARFLTGPEVIVQPGYFFDICLEPSIVVSLITPPKIFAEAIRRLRHLVCEAGAP